MAPAGAAKPSKCPLGDTEGCREGGGQEGEGEESVAGRKVVRVARSSYVACESVSVCAKCLCGGGAALSQTQQQPVDGRALWVGHHRRSGPTSLLLQRPQRTTRSIRFSTLWRRPDPVS